MRVDFDSPVEGGFNPRRGGIFSSIADVSELAEEDNDQSPWNPNEMPDLIRTGHRRTSLRNPTDHRLSAR